MYIRKIGKRYQCQVRARNQSYYKTFVDKTSARLWGHETYLSAMKGVLLGKGLKKTLKELIKQYIAEFTVTKKSKVNETKIWERLIRNHSWLTNKRVINLTPQDFIRFKNIRMKDGYRTTNYELTLLNNLFNKAIKIWLLPINNPVSNVPKLKENKGRYRPIESHEYRKLLHYGDKVFTAVILIARKTGLRHGEIHRLTWLDLDDLRNVLVVRTSKNNNLRTVPISKWLLNYLMPLKKYKTSTIIPISQNAFIKRWQKTLKKLKMHMHIHDFRRNFVQSLINKKVDIPTIARLTGHSSWQQVQLYWGKR